MLIPLIIGGVVGAYFGKVTGEVEGFTTALVPLTIDPNLEAAYRRAVGTMTPANAHALNSMIQMAREHRAYALRHGFGPTFSDMPLPPAPPRTHPALPPPSSPAVTGAAFGHHSLRMSPPAFYGVYGAGALFTHHGYRPGPPSFYSPYGAGGGIFTHHGYRPGPPAFYG